ncbi:plasmid stabilization system protein ParE [Amaricoccus macauensis]|uniref:Plasmid stabilization system protein ParE n=1 Tax=Amaricoccus macauensis TaxID=57001 RepID=A0A840SR49_9RHOB|nr:plasmid stabilization system protein ParE [Amaricoccus macauensis]
MTRAVEWSRDALDDLKAQIAYIAAENPAAAQRVADRLRAAGDALGEMPTGRPGRVAGTYEKSVTGLRTIIAYALTRRGDRETVSILRVIHTARDWRDEEWTR